MGIYSFLVIISGAAFLFFGRRLFWALVFGLGIALGFSMTLQYGLAPQDALIWITALSSGLALVLLARLLPRAAVWITGFGAGAFAGGLLMLVLNFSFGSWTWVFQLCSGCLGMVCFGLWYDRGLLIFSAVIGAGLIANTLALGVPARPLAFLVLLTLGILGQYRLPARGSAAS